MYGLVVERLRPQLELAVLCVAYIFIVILVHKKRTLLRTEDVLLYRGTFNSVQELVQANRCHIHMPVVFSGIFDLMKKRRTVSGTNYQDIGHSQNEFPPQHPNVKGRLQQNLLSDYWIQ
jgi:hypothetical protein